MNVLDSLMAATVSIGGPKPATGYLVSPNRIATCHHVVDVWQKGKTYPVKIGYPNPIMRQAKAIKTDADTDCAILGFTEPVDVAPLPLADQLRVQTQWEAYGFPHSAEGAGLYIRGEVLIPKTKDPSGRDVIQLFSPMAAAGAATPLVGFSGTPVLVDGAVVGHLIRHVGDPKDRKRPSYGIIYATLSKGVEAILDVQLSKRIISPPRLAAPHEFEEEIGKSGVQDASRSETQEGETVRIAKILTGQNRPDLALEILGATQRITLKAQQQYALALAKNGRIDESIALLHNIIQDGANDPETLGLLAGRYKERWRAEQNEAALFKAYETYRKASEKTNDPFNGINAAATALYIGEKQQSSILAYQVRSSLQTRAEQDLDHWALATIAEAWLLEKKLDNARDWYRKAVAKEPDLYQDIAVMRRQARLNLKYLGLNEKALDSTLPVPGVLAFAGHMVDADRAVTRFPQEKIPSVRQAIQNQLKKLGFVQGFSTAAKGSDILFLEEMVKRNVRPIVVMPFPEKDFRAISVGEEWGEKFDNIKSRLEIMTLQSETPTPDRIEAAFARSNEQIQKLAVAHAKRLDVEARLMVVWDGKRTGDGPGGTADVVKLWEYEGYKELIVIDINVVGLKAKRKPS